MSRGLIGEGLERTRFGCPWGDWLAWAHPPRIREHTRPSERTAGAGARLDPPRSSGRPGEWKGRNERGSAVPEMTG
ncbi:hypothetical protein NDU88_004561 [Pleurodeles waltl]|uniref:Uncharacterized protein n=1 Tax=Pleurodeles waltl TaxID=8319 RepID=A0AAV7TUM6_PLEWA|nr:hypothetical protein NDU88_004561 [Pleurodeles waltl]